jgi:hypothetical protein
MKYLCLRYRDQRSWDAMSRDDRDALLAQSAAYDEVLRRSGHLIEAEAVESAGNTTTLRFEQGAVSVVAGPMTNTTGQPLGGLVLIEADDLNHAIQLMSQLPTLRPGGCLEIRPIVDHDDRSTLCGRDAR